MNGALRLFGFEPERWRTPAINAYGAAWFTVAMAALIIGLIRFGGAAFDEPRAFARLVLVPVWGWLGLATGIWLLGGLIAATPRTIGTWRRTVETVGLAHSAVLIFGFIVLVAGGLLEVLGPGSVARWVTFAVWFPALLVASTAWSAGLSMRYATAAVVPVYLGWWLLIGSHVVGRISHLL